MTTRYYLVLPGRYIHWPEYLDRPLREGGPKPLVPRKERVWAGPGTVVKIDTPFLERCIRGQEFKMQKLGSPGKLAVMDPKNYPITVQRELEAERRAREEKAATPSKEAKRVAVEAKPIIEAAAKTGELPGIDTGEEPSRG